MSEAEKLKHCAGCHDDFYNHRGEGAGRCWSLPSMKLILRKEVSIDQRPPWTQKARKFPACYHRERFVYLNPDVTK